jgi:hypothetical protein
LSFRGIITRSEGRELLAEAKLYRRKVPVRAVQITRRFSVESRTGVIETGHPGDYLLEDIHRPDDLWIVRKEVFETEFEVLPETEQVMPPTPQKEKAMTSHTP